jgi:hypothetical protein
MSSKNSLEAALFYRHFKSSKTTHQHFRDLYFGSKKERNQGGRSNENSRFVQNMSWTVLSL